MRQFGPSFYLIVGDPHMSVSFYAANLSREAMRAFDAAPMAPCVQSETGRWLWHLNLGAIDAGMIVVPSLTISDGKPYGFRFALDTPHGCVSLPGFGDFSRETNPVFLKRRLTLFIVAKKEAPDRSEQGRREGWEA